MYDVVIVGAGPAGSTCARYLGKMGYQVALIDRDTFPRDKPCGGGFGYNLLKDFPYLRSRESEFLKGISRVGVIHSPNRKIVLRSNVDMAVALRYDFDNVIFESAVQEGVSEYTGNRVKSLDIRPDYVEVQTTGGGSIKGRVIVGADSVNSTVGRYTGLIRKWPSNAVTACRVAEVPTSEDVITEIFGSEKEYHFFANIGGLPGYGWIFPKRETINIGLGIVGSHAQGLPLIFNQFVRMLKRKRFLKSDADLSAARGGLVPTKGPIKRTVQDRCILVGDAAGMVSPLTGGGIAYAMVAARMAATVLSECLESDTLDEHALEKYERAWRSDFGNDVGPMLLAQRIFTGPFTDVLFEIGSRDEKIQAMVSEAMSESGDANINVHQLVLRTLYVCLREAIGFK